MLLLNKGQSRIDNPGRLATRIDYPERLATRIDNPERLATQGTQGKRRRLTKHKNTAEHRELNR